MTLQRFRKFECISPLSLVIQFASLSLFLFHSRENALLSIHLNFNGLFVCTQISRKKKISSNYPGISRSPSPRWICLNYISGSFDTHKHIKANFILFIYIFNLSNQLISPLSLNLLIFSPQMSFC